MARLLASIDLELDVAKTCDEPLPPAKIAEILNGLFQQVWPPRIDGKMTKSALATVGPPKPDFRITTLQARTRVLAHGATPPPEPATKVPVIPPGMTDREYLEGQINGPKPEGEPQQMQYEGQMAIPPPPGPQLRILAP